MFGPEVDYGKMAKYVPALSLRNEAQIVNVDL